MSYIAGQRVQSHDGKRRGTVARDAAAHSIVLVLWDGDTTPVQCLPESVMPLAIQPGTSARDAWMSGDARLQKARVQ